MQLALALLSASLAMLLLTSQLHGVSGQAYHFSKGWAAGKRASGGTQGPEDAGLQGLASGGRGADKVGSPPLEEGENDVGLRQGTSAKLEKIGQRIGAFLLKDQKTSAQCKVHPETSAIIDQLIQLETLRLEACISRSIDKLDDSTNFLSWVKARLRSHSSAQRN